jgi:hypothetical protein
LNIFREPDVLRDHGQRLHAGKMIERNI